MKIIMVAAISEDGFLTKGNENDVTSWTSKEDKKFFNKIKSQHHLFVMGRKTYDSGTVKPKNGTLKIILTEEPDKYQKNEIPTQIEFKKFTPLEFVNKYQKKYKSCLLFGGGYTYLSFLKHGLVDEIYLTVEPIKHKTGTPLLSHGKKLVEIIDLPSPSIEDLNDEGTKLLHYVLKK